MNLQVTSVIALLSQFKHPQLQEYLLNASLPLAPDCRSLHSTLQNVSMSFFTHTVKPVLNSPLHRPTKKSQIWHICWLSRYDHCFFLQINLQVVQDLRGRIQRIPNFQRNVIAVRRQLMGLATSPEHKRYML